MKLLIWGIYLVVFCLPFYLLRFEVFGIPITALEAMIYGLFVIWLIKRLRVTNYSGLAKRPILDRVETRSGSGAGKLRVTRLFIAIILILLGVTLATVFSLDLRTSAGIWKGWFVAPLLFFLVLVTTIKTFSQIKKILLSLFLSGTVVAIISLIYLIQGKLDPFGRLQAFYNSPNYLAMYLAPALIIGLWFLVQRIAKIAPRDLKLRNARPPSERPHSVLGSLVPPKAGHHARSPAEVRNSSLCSLSLLNLLIFILLPVVCLLFAVILFFTESFGVWLGITAAICFGVVFYLYKKGRKKFALTILYLALLIIVFLGYSALIHRESSFDARMIIWQKTLEIFKTNPILGIGPGTLGDYFSPYPEWGVPQPHNIFLAFLLQTGIIGFIGFIWLLVWFFRTGFKSQITSYKSQVTGYELQVTSLMSVMVYILVHGLVDTTYWKNDLAVIFWLIVGLMVAMKVQMSKSKLFQ